MTVIVEKYLMLIKSSERDNNWAIEKEFNNKEALASSMRNVLKYGHLGIECMFVQVLEPIVLI
jgi:hypothetical protein